MAESRGTRGWLRCGCFGCLGVVLLGGLALTVLWLAVARSAPPEVVQRDLTQPLPPSVVATPGPAASPDGAASSAPGRVILELKQGEFEILPTDEGQPFRVDSTFDSNAFELTEQFDESAEGWTYRVEFRRKGQGWIASLRQLFGGENPEVRILLPRGAPYGLEARLGDGAGRIELGGLWLTDVDLTTSRGGFSLNVAEPLRQPVERFRLRAEMGGMSVSSLGNASPRLLEIDHSMGGMSLDLGGAWRADADVTVRSEMGGGMVLLPENVVLEGVEGFQTGPAEEIDRPRLRFSASSRFGELKVVGPR